MYVRIVVYIYVVSSFFCGTMVDEAGAVLFLKRTKIKKRQTSEDRPVVSFGRFVLSSYFCRFVLCLVSFLQTHVVFSISTFKPRPRPAQPHLAPPCPAAPCRSRGTSRFWVRQIFMQRRSRNRRTRRVVDEQPVKRRTSISPSFCWCI